MQYLFLCSIIIMPNITYSAVSTTLIGLSHMPIFYSIEMYLTGLFPLWLQLQIFGGRSLLGCHDWIQIFFFFNQNLFIYPLLIWEFRFLFIFLSILGKTVLPSLSLNGDPLEISNFQVLLQIFFFPSLLMTFSSSLYDTIHSVVDLCKIFMHVFKPCLLF